MNYSTLYDTSSRLFINLGAVIVTDERSRTVNPFQTILIPSSRDNMDAFFSVTYSKDSTQNEDVQILLKSPLLTVVPEAVVAIKTFVSGFVTGLR
jgi:hypothetical protein